MQHVADELAIRNLVARYAAAIGLEDEETWTATWAANGVWELLGQRAEGPEQALELWRKLASGLAFVVQHAVCGEVRVDGDRGTGSWQIEELGQRRDGTPLLVLGHYADDYVREAAGWRFAARTFSPRYIGPPDLRGAPIG